MSPRACRSAYCAAPRGGALSLGAARRESLSPRACRSEHSAARGRHAFSLAVHVVFSRAPAGALAAQEAVLRAVK